MVQSQSKTYVRGNYDVIMRLNFVYHNTKWLSTKALLGAPWFDGGKYLLLDAFIQNQEILFLAKAMAFLNLWNTWILNCERDFPGMDILKIQDLFKNFIQLYKVVLSQFTKLFLHLRVL